MEFSHLLNLSLVLFRASESLNQISLHVIPLMTLYAFKKLISLATIVGVSCAILILLFAVQPFGTSKIASTFAPIVIIWLLFNAICGIYNLSKYDHSVLKAFSPYFAGQYLIRNKDEGWRSLGGLLLAFTGVEALFADLGAFSKRAVQISWLGFSFPCLLLAYIGQAAYISQVSQTALLSFQVL
jgi:KUP system potassium uptake protein